jgi:hypothetical protein
MKTIRTLTANAYASALAFAWVGFGWLGFLHDLSAIVDGVAVGACLASILLLGTAILGTFALGVRALIVEA